MTAATLHPRLQEIADDFNALPDAERLQLLLEFSEELSSLPPRYAEHPDLLEPVPECQSPLFLAVEVEPDAAVHLFFDAPPDAGRAQRTDLQAYRDRRAPLPRRVGEQRLVCAFRCEAVARRRPFFWEVDAVNPCRRAARARRRP